MIRRLALEIGVAAGAAAGVGWTIARRLTAPVSPRRFDLTVRDIEHDNDGDLIVLDRTDQTTAPGIYNLWFEHGGWAQLSTDIDDRGPTRVARRITGIAPSFIPKAGNRASWSGIYYATPADAELHARDITITTPAGPCLAWRIDGDPSTWAIHIHGLGSTHAGTLRGVRAATELGYTSLVVSYRNTAEGPRVGTGRSTLGDTEKADGDEAIGYAVRRGAQRIVLFGWSMGAAISLQLANQPRHEGLIAALVLDSPVLNWTEVIKANSARTGLPAAAGRTSHPLQRSLLDEAVGQQPGGLTLSPPAGRFRVGVLPNRGADAHVFQPGRAGPGTQSSAGIGLRAVGQRCGPVDSAPPFQFG